MKSLKFHLPLVSRTKNGANKHCWLIHPALPEGWKQGILLHGTPSYVRENLGWTQAICTPLRQWTAHHRTGRLCTISSFIRSFLLLAVEEASLFCSCEARGNTQCRARLSYLNIRKICFRLLLFCYICNILSASLTVHRFTVSCSIAN